MNRKPIDIDAITLIIYFAMALIGILAVYAVSAGDTPFSLRNLFNFDTLHGKQILWVSVAMVMGALILILDYRFFETSAYVIYGVAMGLLILVLFIGKEVNGAKAWIVIGGQQFQPAEFAKLATALALAKFMSRQGYSSHDPGQLLTAVGMILFPILVVILQNDTGSALVFFSFTLVLYREGLSPIVPLFGLASAGIAVLALWSGQARWIFIFAAAVGIAIFLWRQVRSRRNLGRNLMILGVVLVYVYGLTFGVQQVFDRLPIHQQNRIMVWFDPKVDAQGAGYNVIQSKIAIGSGGVFGKGFTEGNYTKYKFVPKQETDFIFCTIGEEFGWIGSSIVILLFLALISRVYFMAENSKTRFARIYGYAVMSIIFFHVLVNIGMTIGLVPVIGIPLPLFSYGGSATLSFTVLIFIMINLYSYRRSVLSRQV